MLSLTSIADRITYILYHRYCHWSVIYNTCTCTYQLTVSINYVHIMNSVMWCDFVLPLTTQSLGSRSIITDWFTGINENKHFTLNYTILHHTTVSNIKITSFLMHVIIAHIQSIKVSHTWTSKHTHVIHVQVHIHTCTCNACTVVLSILFCLAQCVYHMYWFVYYLVIECIMLKLSEFYSYLGGHFV